jgi:hypothetical protein
VDNDGSTGRSRSGCPRQDFSGVPSTGFGVRSAGGMTDKLAGGFEGGGTIDARRQREDEGRGVGGLRRVQGAVHGYSRPYQQLPTHVGRQRTV